MATYKLTGRRYLRKYTAACETPVYAAEVDAQTVVDRLCDVPWEESPVSSGSFALHTEEENKETGLPGFDANVVLRERYDAALFCAGHSGGSHRAYANAACYVFELPDVTLGVPDYPNLSSLKVRVHSDPYNSQGARIAVHVSDTLQIPTNCNDARTGAAHAEGVAPRTVRAVDGADYWYPTTEDCTIEPAGTVALEEVSACRSRAGIVFDGARQLA